MEGAEELNERGATLRDSGDEEGALEAYRAAIRADPDWAVPWYNAGLIAKYRGDWAATAEYNGEAVARDDTDQAAWWNLGIASTALGDWAQARAAWSRCGIEVPEGEGPLELNFGLTPVRLEPDTRGEVVWADRIDPARAIIRNVPLPESGYCYGDLVLHDGAPNGSRMLNGREVPVFDVLERLTRSEFRTYILDLPESTESQRAALSDVAFDGGTWAEDWSQSVSFLCRACSTGLPHARHDSELSGERPNLAVAAAARDEAEVVDLIGRWRDRVGYRGYAGFTLAVDKRGS